MKISILCTLGPASMEAGVIRDLSTRGVDLFRINLSHTPLDAVEPAIRFVREHSPVPICLDTEGPQVRCGPMRPDTVLVEGAEVELSAEAVEGTPERFTLWPRTIFDALAPGAVLSVDFDGAMLRITDVERGRAVATVTAGGRVRSNRAVTADPPPDLPALSGKDLAAIEVGRRLGVRAYALSFASCAEDVVRLRSLAPEGSFIIAKIESRRGVRNMDEIIAATDAALIDRGDLSREIPLEHVPYYQKAIVRRANRWNRPVYVATNLLESMVTNRLPTIAEANDLANTLLDGVHGLVLAAETAIGVDPVGSVDMVRRAIGAFERASESQLLEEDRAPVPVAPGPGRRAAT